MKNNRIELNEQEMELVQGGNANLIIANPFSVMRDIMNTWSGFFKGIFNAFRKPSQNPLTLENK